MNRFTIFLLLILEGYILYTDIFGMFKTLILVFSYWTWDTLLTILPRLYISMIIWRFSVYCLVKLYWCLFYISIKCLKIVIRITSNIINHNIISKFKTWIKMIFRLQEKTFFHHSDFYIQPNILWNRGKQLFD